MAGDAGDAVAIKTRPATLKETTAAHRVRDHDQTVAINSHASRADDPMSCPSATSSHVKTAGADVARDAAIAIRQAGSAAEARTNREGVASVVAGHQAETG